MHRDKAIEEILSGLNNASNALTGPTWTHAATLYDRIKPEFDEEAVREIMARYLVARGKSVGPGTPVGKLFADLNRLFEGEKDVLNLDLSRTEQARSLLDKTGG